MSPGRTRLKLPAYGKALMNARRAGDHPLVVHVIYGEKWFEEPLCLWQCAGACHPKLCLKPAEYAPGIYDFRCVTGLEVALFDQPAASVMPADKIFDLIGEIGRWAADIHVHVEGDELPPSASRLALCQRNFRHVNDPEHNHGWPRWWSAEIEQVNERRRQDWVDAVCEAVPEGV
ncbi:MAG TPA: hypothetical protein VJ797_15625 [Burkholderiales bacterium]|nr:hypothetical protein [Burkholderiales bacterium]